MADNEEQSSTRPPRTVVRPFRGPVGAAPGSPQSAATPATRPAMPPFASRAAPSTKLLPDPGTPVDATLSVARAEAGMTQDGRSAALDPEPRGGGGGGIATSLAADWQSLLRPQPITERPASPQADASGGSAADRAPRRRLSQPSTLAESEFVEAEPVHAGDAKQGNDAGPASDSTDEFEVEAYAYPTVVTEASSDVIDAVVRRDFATPLIGVPAIAAEYPHVDGAAASGDVDAYRLAAVESAVDDVEDDVEEEAQSSVVPAAIHPASADPTSDADIDGITSGAATDAPELHDLSSTAAARVAAAAASPTNSVDSGGAVSAAGAAEDGREATAVSPAGQEATTVSVADDDATRSTAATPASGIEAFVSAMPIRSGTPRIPEHFVLPRFDASAATVADHDVGQAVGENSLMLHVTPPFADAAVGSMPDAVPSSELAPAAAESPIGHALSERLDADAERIIDEVAEARALEARADFGESGGDSADAADRSAREVLSEVASEAVSIATHPAQSSTPGGDVAPMPVCESPLGADPAAAACDPVQPEMHGPDLSLASALERIVVRIRTGELADRRMPTGSSDASVLAAALSTLLAGDS